MYDSYLQFHRKKKIFLFVNKKKVFIRIFVGFTHDSSWVNQKCDRGFEKTALELFTTVLDGVHVNTGHYHPITLNEIEYFGPHMSLGWGSCLRMFSTTKPMMFLLLFKASGYPKFHLAQA